MNNLRKKISAKVWGIPARQRRYVAIGFGVVALLALILALTTVVRYRLPGLIVLTSTAFKNNSSLPAAYTCDGENISPPFDVSQVSSTAKSLALLIEDTTAKDHPTHWVVWNIPVGTSKILEGIRPAGTVARNYAGNFGYSGPCPPAGETHSYTIHLYALSIETLSVNSGSTVTDFKAEVTKVLVDEADLQVTYKKVAK